MAVVFGSFASPVLREGLARVSSGENVNWFNGAPIYGGYVSVVRHAGVVVCEDFRGGVFVFHEPGNFGIKKGLDRLIESA